MKASDSRLLAFARQLHAIDDFDEMVRATSDEIRGSLGYNTAWVAIFDLAARKGTKAAGREGPNLTGSSRGGIVVVERRAWAVFEPLQGPECAVAGLTGARPPGRRRSQCASNSSA